MFEDDDSCFLVFAIVGIGFFALPSAYAAYSAYDLENNYEQVDAKITKTQTDCSIEIVTTANSGKKTFKYLNRNGQVKNLCYDSHMRCSKAESLAEKHGYSKSHVKTRVKITYNFLSPADGKLHKGFGQLVDPSKKFMSEKKISILAHKTKPHSSTFGDDVVEQIK